MDPGAGMYGGGGGDMMPRPAWGEAAGQRGPRLPPLEVRGRGRGGCRGGRVQSGGMEGA